MLHDKLFLCCLVSYKVQGKSTLSIDLLGGRLQLPSVHLFTPDRLRSDNSQEVALVRVLGPPSNALAPVGASTGVGPHVEAPTVVLVHLLLGQGCRLRVIAEFVLDECLADRLDSRQKCVLARDTKIEAGLAVANLAGGGLLIQERKEVSDIADVDVRPNVRTWS
jgi:hypothetical protein